MKTIGSNSRSPETSKNEEFDSLKRRIHGKLVDKLDLNKVGELEGETLRREIRLLLSIFVTLKIRCSIVMNVNG